MTVALRKDIKNEIREYQKIEKEAAFEIGRLLKRAKAEVPRKEWSDWLDELGYNPRTARRYIQIYDRFHTIPEARDVPVSKLTELLSLPSESDPVPLLLDATTDTKKVIREKVREAKGVDKVDKRSPATKTGPSSPKIKSAVEALQNLNDLFTQELEEERINYDQAIEIGRLTKTQQRVMQNVYVPEDDDKTDLLTYLCAHENDADVIQRTMHKAFVVISKQHRIKVSAKGYDLYEKLYEASELENYEEFKRLVDEIYSRLDEFTREYEEKKEEDWKQRGSGFDVSTQSTPATKILGLPENATADEARKRCRQLMKSLHPDHGGSAYLFDIAKKAYDEMKARQ